jgi:hypothetical protein
MTVSFRGMKSNLCGREVLSDLYEYLTNTPGQCPHDADCLGVREDEKETSSAMNDDI